MGPRSNFNQQKFGTRKSLFHSLNNSQIIQIVCDVIHYTHISNKVIRLIQIKRVNHIRTQLEY